MATPTKLHVRAAFELFNYAFFAGSLPEIAIHCRRMTFTDGVSFDPCDVYEHGLILINPTNDRMSGWMGTLLHEMIHAWLDRWEVDEFDCDLAPPFHGPIFTAECNRIGRLLGLPDVDESDSWAWPDACFEAVSVPCIEE